MNDIVARIDKKSMEYNRQGYLAYEKKDYLTAKGLFQLALQADDANMFSHYNLACVLSLLYADPDLSTSSFESRDQYDKTIAQHLSKASYLDIHFGYQLFIDADLDPLRKRGSNFSEVFPCPGDCCPDQWFFFRENGTVGYSATYPDLSGMGSPRAPEPVCEGWYTVIGNRVYVLIPGKDELLRTQFSGAPPSYMQMEPGDFVQSYTAVTDERGRVKGIRNPLFEN